MYLDKHTFNKSVIKTLVMKQKCYQNFSYETKFLTKNTLC